MGNNSLHLQIYPLSYTLQSPIIRYIRRAKRKGTEMTNFEIEQANSINRVWHLMNEDQRREVRDYYERNPHTSFNGAVMTIALRRAESR